MVEMEIGLARSQVAYVRSIAKGRKDVCDNSKVISGVIVDKGKNTDFVGRRAASKNLADVLSGADCSNGPLTIQSIEGPGGIGKTTLLKHVMTATDLMARKYVVLWISGQGSDGSDGQSLYRLVAKMIERAQIPVRVKQPSSYFFPATAGVLNEIEAMRASLQLEAQSEDQDSDQKRDLIGAVFDMMIGMGKAFNEAIPASIDRLDFAKVENARKMLRDLAPNLKGLKQEAVHMARLGFGKSKTFRNAIRQNACKQVADALVSDLSAVLSGYRAKDRGKPTLPKLVGAERLLLIVDDYEYLQSSMSAFLTAELLPELRQARFESVVVILGRDKLVNTNTAWDQDLRAQMRRAIEVDALSREEMDALVEAHGINTPQEKNRAWSDTQGYPFYVQLWVEEAESGGRTAVMLKRFYDRITRWQSQQQKGWLEYVLFMRAVNLKTLRAFLDKPENAEDVLKWFESEGSIRDPKAQEFTVREYLRTRLLDYLRITNPERFDALSDRSANLGVGVTAAR